MYIRYDDIIRRVADRPLWWSNGVPRFDRFQPSDVSVYCRQVALVHTECQACGYGYDVAVEPRPYGRDLRNLITYGNDLDVGDPPNACPDPSGCTGRTMGSMEIAVLEFWEQKDVLKGWIRDPSMERPLVDADWQATGKFVVPQSVFSRIHGSDRKDEWMLARREGSFARMAAILNDFGCERAREVAHMLDLERRHKALIDEFVALHEERFGKEERQTR